MKKKNQHYIPQKYLASFCVDGNLFCLRDGRIFSTTPRNIGSENYFYKMRKLNEQEIKFIKAFNLQIADKCLRRYADDRLNVLLRIGQFEETFDSVKPFLYWASNNSSNMELNAQTKELLSESQMLLDTNWNNYLEDLLASKEGYAETVFTCLRNKDFSVLENDPDGINKLTVKEYIYLQYFRTKKVATLFADTMLDTQKNILQHPEYTKIDFLLVHFALLPSYAFNAACIEAGEIHILTNNSHVPFITSDQPVINLSTDVKNENGETVANDMYLPLTPKLAIITTAKQISEFICDKNNVCELEAQRFNDIINENKLLALYSNNERYLKRYE